MGMVGVEKSKMTPGILVLVSGTHDRNRNAGDRARMKSLVSEIENSAPCVAAAKVANKT